MSKIITPPQIDDLDGLLDLLLHPQKMVAYLTQLRDMRDAVNESLAPYTEVVPIADLDEVTPEVAPEVQVIESSP